MTTDLDSFLIADVLGDGEHSLETEHRPPSRTLRHSPKREYRRMHAQDSLADVLKAPPLAGESVHVVSDAKWDFWTWVPLMVDWIGRADALWCSTWTASRPNVVELFEQWDAGKLGMVHFLTGLYFKRRETAVYSFLLDGIRARGGRYRASQNHAKVLLLDNPEREAYIVVEGSANLTSNPRTEQYTLTNHRPLWEFHRAWMEELFVATDRQKPGHARPDDAPPRVGFSHRRAGLGVFAYTNSPAARRKLLAWKLSPAPDPKLTAEFAKGITELIRQWAPTLPPAAVVTTPPQGASWPGPYCAEAIARAVADSLGVEYRVTLHRTDAKEAHGIGPSLKQADFRAETTPGAAYLVVDDCITSGKTMRLALQALRDAGNYATGFAFNGS